MIEKRVNITVSMAEGGLADSIAGAAQALPNIRITPPAGQAGELGRRPDIVIINDQPEEGRTLAELASLRQSFPGAALFVVSRNPDPQHIVRSMKAGCAEYFLLPVDADQLARAVDEVRAKLGAVDRLGSGAVYTFMSSKGGLGATVLSVNAAVAMAKNGADRVALYDMAFQSGDSSVLLDIVPDTTVMDLCRNFHRLDSSLLLGAMISHASGLQLLAAPLSPEDSEEMGVDHMVRILSLLRQQYDKVIIDCTSMLVHHHSIEAFNVSDLIFIITDLSLPSIRNATRLSRLIAKLGISDRKIEFVVNRFTKGNLVSIKEAEKNLGKRFYWLFPNQFDEVVNSINEGVPLVQGNPRASFSKNMMEFIGKVRDPSKLNGFRGIKNAFGKSI